LIPDFEAEWYWLSRPYLDRRAALGSKLMALPNYAILVVSALRPILFRSRA
jgi:hypothetical protein